MAEVSPPPQPPSMDTGAAMEQTSAMGSIWNDEQLSEAIALFQKGSFQEAQTLALESIEGTNKQMVEEETDTWRVALDDLARAHEDAGDPPRAEALYLRMLAWWEGAQQFRLGHFGIAGQLFDKSPAYNTVEDATWFLQNLQPDDGHAIPEVVALLSLGGEVAAKASMAVCTLALKKENRPRITECGALELVTKAVAYPDHVEISELQAGGCAAIRMLCTGHRLAQQNRKTIITRLGGAEALVGAMRNHPGDCEVQREACGAMRAVATKNPLGTRRLLEQGASGVCLCAIAECPDEAVADAACGALEALQNGLPDHDSVSSTRLRAEREAGLRYCEEQYRRHLPANDKIILQGLLGATNVFLTDTSFRHRVLGLIELVVACMQAFPGYCKVQLLACANLLSLTSDHQAKEEAVAKVAQAGGIGAVLQAMKDLPTNLEIQRLAICVTRNLVRNSNGNKTLAVKAQGIPTLLGAMKRFSKDAKLQEEAIGVLTHLCDTVGRSMVAARQGVLETVIAAVKRHTNTGRVAEHGLIMFCMFCDDEKLRYHVSKSGILPIAKELSRKGQGEAQRWAHELLQELSDGPGTAV